MRKAAFSRSQQAYHPLSENIRAPGPQAQASLASGLVPTESHREEPWGRDRTGIWRGGQAFSCSAGLGITHLLADDRASLLVHEGGLLVLLSPCPWSRDVS